MTKESFSVSKRLQSFRFAGQGIVSFLQKEHNAWLHFIASVAVITLGFLMAISRTEWLALVVVIGLVWMAEMFNTCLEALLDFLSPAHHPQVKFIKDVAAGAVLIAAAVALVTGLIIFIPHFY